MTLSLVFVSSSSECGSPRCSHKIKWVAPSAVKHLRRQALGPMGYDEVEWPDWDPNGDGGGGGSRRTGRITHAIDQPNIVTTNQGKNAYSVMQFYELGCELWRPVAPPPLPSLPTNMGGGPKSPKSVLRKPTARAADVLNTEGGEGGDLPPLRGGGLRNRRRGGGVSYEGTQGDATRVGTIRLSWDSKQKAGWTRMKTPASGRTSPTTPKGGLRQRRRESAGGRGESRAGNGDVLNPDVESYLPKIASRFGKALEGEVQWQKHRKMMSRRYAVSRKGKRMYVSDLLDGGTSHRSGVNKVEAEAGL